MNTKHKTKVLIIDDNYSILEYLKTVLRRYNFDIKTSTNGYDGLQEVADFQPDIIFLDLMMPNIDGLQLLQLKKKLSDIKDIPVIVISANAGRNNVMAAIEAGADRVLAKPINVKQLKSAVDEVLCGDFFSIIESRDEREEEAKELPKSLEFVEKFEEYKESLVGAIKNRDSDSIKRIITLLKEYSAKTNNEQIGILFEIGSREYAKPSDWMFAEMKVKEIEQNLKLLLNKV